MAARFKICISSTLHRPDSWKTNMSPAASTLRKLVRDPKCLPVLRGILETLLHYITHELHKWAAKSRSQEKPVFGVAAQRNTGCPDQKSETIVKKIQLQICRKMNKLPELEIMNQKKTVEISSGVSEKRWLDSQKSRLSHKCDGDQRTGDLIARRITTFQLLQSKFTRSTPKPPITHQREVGSLPSSRGVSGHVNYDQDGEHDNKHKGDRGKKQQGLKRESTVKNIVAKFALAEKKEQGLETLKKEPVKPRLIGRGILLSSIMQRFENMATVCKGRDLKHSHERPSGEVKLATSIKERGACFKGEQQEGGRSIQKQSKTKQMKNKSVRFKLKREHTENGQKQTAHQVKQILTNTTSGTDVKTYTTTEQREDQHSEQRTHCLVKHANQSNNMNVEVQDSRECGNMQTTAESQSQSIVNRIKCARPEQLLLTSVTEWSPPQPQWWSQQVEVALSWHVATIKTCSPEWAKCVLSSPGKYQQVHKPEDTEKLDKTPWKTKDSPQEPSKRSHSESVTLEPPTSTTEEKSTYEIKEVSEDTCHDPLENQDTDQSQSTIIQRSLPSYVIPRVYRFAHQQDPVEFSSQLATQAEDHLDATPAAQLISPVTTLDNVSEAVETFQDTVPGPPDDFSLHVNSRRKPVDGKQEEKDIEARELKEEYQLVSRTSQQQSLECSADATFGDSDTCAVTLPENQPEGDGTKHKPKYTTINYGDPSVKQPYKPKIIRFTDTFTF